VDSKGFMSLFRNPWITTADDITVGRKVKHAHCLEGLSGRHFMAMFDAVMRS